ncbi:MAG: hypothetical protein L3K19_01910 [Thermoplasmata archaeon]|nr:hypothetical protein [Thermoplasmata archaeon]
MAFRLAKPPAAWTWIALLVVAFSSLLPSALGAPPRSPAQASQVHLGSTSRYEAVPTYAVNVTERYLPSGTNWTLAVGGRMWNSSIPSILLAEPNGTYPYTASAPTWPGGPSVSGSFVVAGSPVTVLVNLTSAPGSTEPPASAASSSAPVSPSFVFALAVVVLASGVGGVLVVARRRTRAISPPAPRDSTRSETQDAPAGGASRREPEDADPLGHML